MSNILNNKFNQIDLRISKSEYWDFSLSNEADPSIIYDGNTLYDDIIISYIDINNMDCCTGDSVLYGLTGYTWPQITAYTQNLNLSNIGFTGIDNGFITDTSIEGVTGSTLNKTGDTRLTLCKVTGNTNTYVYPTEFVKRDGFTHIKLDGGFYQGFFKSGDNYCVLPDKFASEITFEVILTPVIPFTITPNTLNAKYPDNKGFFLYIGTRSENKFWYDYSKNDTDKYEISKTGQTPTIPSGLTISTSDGVSIYEQNSHEIETDNKYILFNRTSSGYNVNDFDDTATYILNQGEDENLNLFQYFNRTKTGYTVNNYTDISGITKPYEVVQDVLGNCIGFRLKENSETGDTCSVGYRIILPSCDDNENYIIQEEYSESIIHNNTLTFIAIRLVFNDANECSNNNRTFKIYIYANGNLVLVSKELPELIFRKLNDTDQKQEGVAYNISLGGGSQGLSDMIGFNTGYSTQYLLPIEKHFAGSFIGDIYKFRIYEGKMDYTKIMNNYIFTTKERPFHIDPTVLFTITGNPLFPETVFKREFGNNISYLGLSISLNEPFYTLTKYEVNYYNASGVKTNVTGVTLNPLGGIILDNYEYVTNNSSIIVYESLVYDTSVANEYVNRNTITIEYDHMIFYGTAKQIPTNSADIRALNNKIFAKGVTNFIINTETIDEIFVFAIPNYVHLHKVEDEIMNNVISLDITDLFTENLFDVNDAGGVATPYKIYIMKNAIPYSSNHPLLVTLSETSDNSLLMSPKFLYFAATNDTTVEVGTKLPDNLTFNFNISNIENVKQNSINILDMTNTNNPIISNQSAVSPIISEIGNVKYNNNGAIRTWRCTAEDKNGILFNSPNYTITWRLKTFFGSINEFPTNSETIRLLSGYIWDNVNVFNINIDTLKYTIAVRNGKTIKSIITENQEDITSEFLLRPNQIAVYLADNMATEMYNVYDFEIVTPINNGLLATVTLM